MINFKNIDFDFEVDIPVGNAALKGDLVIPGGARAIVVFAHGSGSGRFSTRNRFVAGGLQRRRLATLLLDLLTPEEEAVDIMTMKYRFDMEMLAGRVVGATDWLLGLPLTRSLRIGYFGSSTGAAAALIAAGERSEAAGAVVSRGGRPDLAMGVLDRVIAPILLIVGGNDLHVIRFNREAFAKIPAEKKLEIVPGAGHLFEEHGALERVVELGGQWFQRYLTSDEEYRRAV